MNLQKAEQAVKNAQNQLDEAMRQLEAAKDPWRHDKPRWGEWIIVNTPDAPVPAFLTGSSRSDFVSYPKSPCCESPGYDYLDYVQRRGWRYAEKGEVNISW